MSGLQAHVDEYLRLRRALGFKLKEEGRLLDQLVAYLDAAGVETVSTELAVRWARLPVGVHPNHWSKRLRVARGFAAYLQTLDPRTEIPPPDIFRSPMRDCLSTGSPAWMTRRQGLCSTQSPHAFRLPHAATCCKRPPATRWHCSSYRG